MGNKPLSLVKYAGDNWVTLADFTSTRDIEGYSDHSSVKSAIRTFVVKLSPDKYIAFRGEKQIKSIVHENKDNPLFHAEDFKGTRTALIHWSMLPQLEARFKVAKDQRTHYKKFTDEATKHIAAEQEKAVSEGNGSGTVTDIGLSNKSGLLRQLRTELNRIDKEIEVRVNNREKIMQALNALESLELEEAQ